VAQACAAAADLGVWMMNVHASGGRRMMDAAREMLERRGGQRPLLIGVTVLTSMGAEDLAEVGVPVAPADQVLRLAGLAHKAGLDGVVCSPKESALLRHRLGEDFLLVTPGVRPAGADIGDQKRVLSPREAVQQGSDYLVVGRPVTQAADPVAVLRAINTEIAP
jgi:orotidine-5'-phosphate decarboxylase